MATSSSSLSLLLFSPLLHFSKNTNNLQNSSYNTKILSYNHQFQPPISIFTLSNQNPCQRFNLFARKHSNFRLFNQIPCQRFNPVTKKHSNFKVFYQNPCQKFNLYTKKHSNFRVFYQNPCQRFNLFTRKHSNFRVFSALDDTPAAVSGGVVNEDSAETIVRVASDNGDVTTTVITVLLTLAFVALTILTIGVIYISVTDFLTKREKEKFEKEEEEAKKKKGGKKVRVRSRAGPRGFGQKIDEDDD